MATSASAARQAWPGAAKVGTRGGGSINKGTDSSKGLVLWPRTLEGMPRTVETPRVGRDAYKVADLLLAGSPGWERHR